jgi:hypothetical protein
MKSLNVIFTFIFLLSVSGLMAQMAFTHQANASNTSRHITTINHGSTNNKANALVFITSVFGKKYDNHVSGVWYNAGKWKIYHEDKKPMPTDAKYNVLVMSPSNKAFMHRASAGNTDRHITTINHPSCNNNPNAVIFVTQNYKSAYNPNAVGVWYNGSKWTIYNQNKSAMPKGANFNVLVFSSKGDRLGGRTNGKASIFTGSSSTVNKAYNHLRNLPFKGKNTKIFVTQNFGKNGPYNAKVPAVWNFGPNWTVYNKDRSNMPNNTKFNVLTIGGNEILKPDEEVAPIGGTVSTKAGYARVYVSGGYAGRLVVSYKQNGKTVSQKTGKLAINGAKTITIPKGVSEIKVRGEGWDITRWVKIFEKSYGTNPPNKCFNLKGTIFKVSYDNKCAKNHEGGYVRFFNESGYVAKFTVSYTFKGERIKTETGDMALSARKTIKIPKGATRVTIKGEGSAVFGWKDIFEKTYNSAPNKCFKVYATIFDPKWNNNCD